MVLCEGCSNEMAACFLNKVIVVAHMLLVCFTMFDFGVCEGHLNQKGEAYSADFANTISCLQILWSWLLRICLLLLVLMLIVGSSLFVRGHTAQGGLVCTVFYDKIEQKGFL